MVYGKKMERETSEKRRGDELMPVPIFAGRPDAEKNAAFIKNVLIVFALFTTLSLLVVGCSSTPSNNTNTQSNGNVPANTGVPAESSGGVTPLNESKNVSMDATNKSEIQKTQQAIAQVIADGTYDDTVAYFTHVGQETVEIKVTTQGDVVTDASVTAVNADGMSQRYIGAFNSALPNLVVGKKISDISIPHTVSGSSLTSAAFAQHLQDLITQHPG